MAWSDYRGGLGELHSSPRESERFGCSIARVTVGTGWDEEFATVEGLGGELWSRVAAAESDIVVVRYPSELAQLPARGTVTAGWTVIPAGSIVYWSLGVAATSPEPPPDGLSVVVRTGASADDAEFGIPRFLEALGDSFTDYTSHYAANPLLDPALVTAGYREWAQSTLQDARGQAYGLVEDGRLIGVAVSRTLKGTAGAREIELAGMVAEAQGDGRYRHLLHAVVADAHADGIDTVYISTQSHNIRVQRAWASFGFRPERSIDTLHAVRSPLLARFS